MKKQKKWLPWYLVISVLIFLMVFCWYLSSSGAVILKKTDIQWYLSATAQSFAALLGIVGMFLLFRLELIQKDIDSVRREMDNIQKTIDPIDFHEYMSERLGLPDGILIEGPPEYSKYLEKEEELKRLKGKKSLIFHNVNFPLILTVVIFISSLALLPFTEIICDRNLGLNVVGGMLELSVIDAGWILITIYNIIMQL